MAKEKTIEDPLITIRINFDKLENVYYGEAEAQIKASELPSWQAAQPAWEEVK